MTKFLLVLFLMLPAAGIATAADEVPTDIQMPGTQPLEIGNLESPNKCDNCHGGYNKAVEPAHNWSGSMMAQAGRDPIFWATMAIAEQDFGGSGDLCLRCHSTGGWLAGRSTPTDGSGLASGDSDGVECDYCHKLTNPDDEEHQGVMNSPFIANDPSEGWYGSGMSSMWGGSDKLGPYNNADARHQFMHSDFHREPEFCGTCHDVSNPAVGDLAHNNGAFQELGGESSGVPGSGVAGKAAFNNPPYAYGIVERTFSEHMSTNLWDTSVNSFGDTNSELPRGGAFQAIYEAATAADGNADYTNPGKVRTYTCQTCHMRPVTGTGANKRGVPVRDDLPLHDMTGGNYWIASAIEYLDNQGKLRLGGGLTGNQIDAMQDAALRAREQLELAATLEVENEDGQLEVEIVNHTGHKLITGYPEGRRMWLNVKWFDIDGNQLSHEDGKYGDLSVDLPGRDEPLNVKTIINLEATKEFLYEAHMGMTKEWAKQLLSLGWNKNLPLSYDRLDGTTVVNLGDLGADTGPTETATFHFAINNIVKSDNRIPPFGMNAALARERNATPVPDDLYLEDGTYKNYDEVKFIIPTMEDGFSADAVSATIDLLYQPTSWEYIQFLYLANDGSVAFLAEEGANMLDAWLNTGMAEPMVMASANWAAEPGTEPPPGCEVSAPELISAAAGDKEVALDWAEVVDNEISSYKLYYDQSDKAQLITSLNCADTDCLAYTDTGLNNEQTYCYKVTAYRVTQDEGECESAFSNIMCATPQAAGQVSATAGVVSLETGKLVKIGKGKNATQVFEATTIFSQGDSIVIRATVVDETGSFVSGASIDFSISGSSTLTLGSAASDANGIAYTTWSTQAPNKKGQGGTETGGYTATVSGLTSNTHDWDNNAVSINITLD